MLEKIREGSQGFWAIVVLGLVILSFVFAGVGGYITSSNDVAAATVNGEDISAVTLERAYENERARLEQQFGEAFSALASDAEYLREFRQSVLDRLIGDKLVEQTARELGLRVSDAQIRQAVVEMPAFQIAGQFNNDRFQAIIRQSGFTSASFVDYMRLEMTRQQVQQALVGSEFALSSEAGEAFLLQAQTRDAKYLLLDAQQFAADVELTDEDVNAFYQSNLSNYDTEEQVSIAYVELKTSDLIPSVDVTEDELLAFYEQTSSNYRTEEERRASHILIEFGEDKDAAKASAEALLARVNGGEDFATVASTESADTFSAEIGGDLDWFGRGVMDPAFEDATFSLANVGDVTPVVESAFGFHIIKLTDVKAEQVTPFEDVRADIEQSVKADKAAEEFFALQTRMEEVAFESPDSLDDVAAEINKEIVETALFSRNAAPAPIAGTNALISAFDLDLIDQAVNSEVIEISSDHVMVLRVTKHEQARTKTLDEVRTDIESELTAEKAQSAAKAWGEELLTSVKAGDDVTEQLQSKGAEWQEQGAIERFGSGLDRDLTDALFSLAPGDDGYAVVELGNGNVGMVQLLQVNNAEPAELATLTGLQQRLESMRSQTVYVALIDALKANADIVTYN